jgi:hypothetical protein
LGGSLQPLFAVYASVLQHPAPGVDLLIRPRGGAPIDATAVAAIHRQLMLPRSAARLTEAELVADELRPLQWFAGRIAYVGWATLVPACCGTFSLMWLWLLSLQSELGLRRAVGARRRTVIAFVLLRACGVGLGGMAVGLWFGPAIWNLLHDVLADFPVWDGGTLLRYALILLFAVLVGALPLAVRATRVSPGRLLS